MLKIDKILLPLDFVDTSLNVVHQATALARHFHSEVVLLHVVTPLSYAAEVVERGQELEGRDLLAEIVRWSEKHKDQSVGPEFNGLRVKTVLLKGDPAHGIVRTAHEEKASLIVMPTHGYGAFYRFLLGSVTAKVLHDSECPVWTGAHLDESPKGEFAIRHILCAVDFSPHSRNTVGWAAQIAAEFNARLTLAHITPSVEIYGPGGSYVLPDLKEELVNSSTEQIAKLQKDISIKADVFIDSGDVSKLLSRAAKETKADLLVIGCHPSGGRLRSSGYAIIHESQIPVLSV